MLFDSIRHWYGRFERPISSLSLVLGFVFDAVTLERVDTPWENFWILGHLIIVGVFIALININKSNIGDETDPHKPQFWYVNILQFFFGGILSTYLVFYFRSADIFVTWPFIALLVLAFWANESLKRHYVRLSFQIGLFFLSVYSFAIFLVPVLLHRIGYDVFLISGLASVIFIMFFILILFYFTKDILTKNKRDIIVVILSIFAVVNILYFTNLIPPIPLSLKDAGMYHSISKSPEGDYIVQYENPGWRGYFELYHTLNLAVGENAYAYSAIFSPTKLDIVVYHKWERYDEAQKAWVSEGEIVLPVIGGRGGGFRTYSYRSDLDPGKWRVSIETQSGHLIGRLRFNVVRADYAPSLVTVIKK
jgi:hypothetical protein